MNRDFMGVGWKYPVGTDATGKIAMSRHEEDIREAILIILGTAKGERIMRPEFGCGIHDYVFSAVNTPNLSLLENSVREALTIWEPRIEVLNVKPDTQRLDEGKLDIRIDYSVRATNTRFNLVYPFYLEEGR